jgi:hypothetical protein
MEGQQRCDAGGGVQAILTALNPHPKPLNRVHCSTQHLSGRQSSWMAAEQL